MVPALATCRPVIAPPRSCSMSGVGGPLGLHYISYTYCSQCTLSLSQCVSRSWVQGCQGINEPDCKIYSSMANWDFKIVSEGLRTSLCFYNLCCDAGNVSLLFRCLSVYKLQDQILLFTLPWQQIAAESNEVLQVPMMRLRIRRINW